MSANEIHVNDIGTIFRVTFKNSAGTVVPIPDATVKQIRFKKPDKTVLPKDGDFTIDGSDGQLQYTSLSGDLDQAGHWLLQGYVKLPTGEWSSDIVEFEVYPNLV